jgi:hypothetical protein
LYLSPTYQQPKQKLKKIMYDSTFIRNLQNPFSAVLPSGALLTIQQRMKTSPHTPGKVLAGAWTNEAIVHEALQIIREHRNLINRFLDQFDAPPTPPGDEPEEYQP